MNYYKVIFFAMLLAIGTSIKAQSIDEKQQLAIVIDQWHKAASDANFKTYFELMTDDAIFIGTDANEYWNKQEFQNYAKPHFDKGKAWSFTALERHVYFDTAGKTAWFDELLDTQMKICRGSGVLVKVGNQWKIQHYVLSMTVPNETSKSVITIKAPLEEPLIQKLRAQLEHK
ncbi:MAG: nuclear transport factor 2 family protein [Flavobacterium sp.]|nr:nuclear transport factor 2 family protein [Flavobacterium sp.]